MAEGGHVHPMDMLDAFGTVSAQLGGLRSQVVDQGYSDRVAEELILEMWRDAMHAQRVNREKELLKLQGKIRAVLSGGRRGRA